MSNSINFPIKLPAYYIEPSVLAVYDDGVKSKIDGYCNYIELDIEIEPSLENAQAFIDKHIPKEFHNTCRYVSFRARQPLKKVRYGQGELADDGNVYVGSMEFSVDVVEWNFARMGCEYSEKLDTYVDVMQRPYKKKSSQRCSNMNVDCSNQPLKIYIKPDVLE